MIGRHGTDGFETLLLATLSDAGVDTSGILAADGPSGVALILVAQEGSGAEAGQNMIVVVPGSNGRLAPADVRAAADRIAAAGIILTQLETPLEVLRETLAVASRAGVPVMLDPAPAQALDAGILQQVAWLTPNETEAAALVGEVVPEEGGLAAFAEQLLALGPENILLKLGSKRRLPRQPGGSSPAHCRLQGRGDRHDCGWRRLERRDGSCTGRGR